MSAFGAMSRIATKPSATGTWSPSRTSVQKRQRQAQDTLFGDGRPANGDELAHRRVDEPGRVVVAVAAAGTVDEDDVLAPTFAASARGRLVDGARSRALRSSSGRRHGVARGGHRPGRGEYGKT